MPDLDSRPQVINIDHYAGDTLTLHVKIDPVVVAGRDWKAQVRARQDSQRVDAEFVILPSTLDPNVVNVVLRSADCQQLARRGKYTGFWDVQLSDGGADPVTTLAYGKLTIFPDVTRTTP